METLHNYIVMAIAFMCLNRAMAVGGSVTQKRPIQIILKLVAIIAGTAALTLILYSLSLYLGAADVINVYELTAPIWVFLSFPVISLVISIIIESIEFKKFKRKDDENGRKEKV